MYDLLQYRAWALNESYFDRMYPTVIDAIRQGHNLVKPTEIKDFLPRIEALLAVGNEAQATAATEITFSYDENTRLPVAKTNGKSIALIPVVGPLAKYNGLCSLGMQGYQAMLSRVNTTASIDGVVFIMDSPGGTVDGTPEFGLAIKNSTKPVGIFGDNQVASAAYWLSSQASVIVGNKNNPTAFGSIGVLMALPNYQNVMKAGLYPDVKIYRAKQSTEKALVNSIEPISQEAEQDLQDDLNSIGEMFISTVKDGRGDRLDRKAEGLFTGRMFDVSDAKKMGMIDYIGTLQLAITKVAEISRQKSKGTNLNANNSMKFPKLSSLFGGKSKEAKEVNLKVTSEGLTADDDASATAAEQRLADMEAENSRLKADNEAKDKTISTLNATVAEQKTQITTLEGEKTKLTEENAKQKAELDKKPTGNLTTVIPGTKNEAGQAADTKTLSEDTGKSKFRTAADDEADQYVSAMYPNEQKK